MTSFISALDKSLFPKTNGENGHIQYSWSEDMKEKFSQFYFQLVRTSDTRILEKQLNELLSSLTKKKSMNYNQYNEQIILLEDLYKLIVHTRDIPNGKGEYTLSYMQLYIWYKYFPGLAKYAFNHFLYYDTIQDTRIHPFGSWKDVKYFSEYVRNKTTNELHPLIQHAIHNLIIRIRLDMEEMKKGNLISLAGKWCPREKGRFSWLYKHIIYQWRPDYFATAISDKQKLGAYRKASSEFRRSLSMLNRYLDTTQVKMCDKRWSDINFNLVSSITLTKNKNAYLNQTKQKTQRSTEEDRILCRENILNHILQVKQHNSNIKINGKRTSIYEFVKQSLYSETQEERDIINLQWNDHQKENNNNIGNIIPLVDTSLSMTDQNSQPLYNAIGLSIRISEKTNPVFQNRIMTFSAYPEWIKLYKCDSFVDKVRKVRHANWGMNTNFYSAMKMILDVVLENQMPPSKVENMVLAVFSDMQIDCADIQYNDNNKTIMDKIKDMYKIAGLNSKWKKPYNPPHILFWNLRSTNGFPTKSNEKNVTMLSGYSSQLLNEFSRKGIKALQDYTPFKMIHQILSNERYSIMNNKFYQMIE